MSETQQARPDAVAGQVDRVVRPLRLYVVRVVREAYVLAEDWALVA